MSKGFIWSCPIVRKTPSKSLWPLQQTSWVRQVRPRVQDFVLLGCYCFQESRMWDFPWPSALQQGAGTLQDDFSAQAVSSGTNPSTESVFWHSLCHLGCPAAGTARLHLKWERAGAARCRDPQLGVSIPQGCMNSFRHSHWRKNPECRILKQNLGCQGWRRSRVSNRPGLRWGLFLARRLKPFLNYY